MITFHILDLELTSPFRIAHGSSARRTTLIAQLGPGMGEGAFVPYYPATVEGTRAWIAGFDSAQFLDTLPLDDLLDLIPPDAPAPVAAAVDLAVHDLCSKRAGLSLRLFLKLPDRSARLVRTLSMPANDDELALGLSHLLPYACDLKLKLGSGNIERDIALFESARRFWTRPIAVDANGGWSPEEALHFIKSTRNSAPLFIEEPVSGPAGWTALAAWLPPGHPPLYADESLQNTPDLDALRGCADGVNVKLLKTRGLRGALSLIERARKAGLRIMIGSMVETSLGCTAAAHLAGLADVADLDGYLFLKNDPFRGLEISNGRLALPSEPGIGASLRTPDAPA